MLAQLSDTLDPFTWKLIYCFGLAGPLGAFAIATVAYLGRGTAHKASVVAAYYLALAFLFGAVFVFLPMIILFLAMLVLGGGITTIYLLLPPRAKQTTKQRGFDVMQKRGDGESDVV